MATNATHVSGGISFTGMLAVVFVALKLCSVINWSWWWVLAPLWAPAAFFITIFILYAMVRLLVKVCKRKH